MKFSEFRSLVLKYVHRTYSADEYARSNAPRLCSTIDDIIADEWAKEVSEFPRQSFLTAVEYAEIKVIDYIRTII